jgi:hypothetical protein
MCSTEAEAVWRVRLIGYDPFLTSAEGGSYDWDIPRANIRISRQVRRGLLGNAALIKVLNRLIFRTLAEGTDTGWTEIHRSTIPEAERFT